MNTSTQHNIASLVTLATSVLPQAATGNVNGATIDRFIHNMALSCVLHQVAGASSGAPTAISLSAKLQHSPDGTTWTDYIAPGTATVAATPALSAINTEASVSIDLASAYRYIRAVSLLTLTGGTTPTLLTATDIVLGGEPLDPAA